MIDVSELLVDRTLTTLTAAGNLGINQVLGLGASDVVDTGVVVGAASLLAFLFRYWFALAKRNTDETWSHADEYRIERDFYRLESRAYQARWLAAVNPNAAIDVPALPNLDAMRVTARAAKADHSEET